MLPRKMEIITQLSHKQLLSVHFVSLDTVVSINTQKKDCQPLLAFIPLYEQRGQLFFKRSKLRDKHLIKSVSLYLANEKAVTQKSLRQQGTSVWDIVLSPCCGFDFKPAVTEDWATVVVNNCPNLFRLVEILWHRKTWEGRVSHNTRHLLIFRHPL